MKKSILIFLLILFLCVSCTSTSSFRDCFNRCRWIHVDEVCTSDMKDSPFLSNRCHQNETQYLEKLCFIECRSINVTL